MLKILVILFFALCTAMPCTAKIYSITDFEKSLETIVSSKPPLRAYPAYCRLLKDAVSDNRNIKFTQAFIDQTLNALKRAPQKFYLKIQAEILRSVLEGLSKNNKNFNIYDPLFLRSLGKIFSTLPLSLKTSASFRSVTLPIQKYLVSHGGTVSDWEAFVIKTYYDPWIHPYIPPIPPPVS
jgi:hypothetical protein